jgi:nitrite reductase (NO-forming)
MRGALLLLAALLAPLALADLADAKDQVIDIEAGTSPDGTMYLKPAKVTVPLGANVTLRVHNVDSIFHDVALLGYNGRDTEIELPAGATDSGTFKADKAGEFRIVCEVSGHKQKGMTMQLLVEEPKNAAAPGWAGAMLALVAVAALARRR